MRATAARLQEVRQVPPDAVGRVVAVDQGEVDVAPGLRELGEHLPQHHVAVAGVHVDVARKVERLGLEVERVHLGAVRRDPAEAAALRRPELDREPGPEGGEHALRSPPALRTPSANGRQRRVLDRRPSGRRQ